MAIEVDTVPQPENINVGFNPSDPEEADIERQLLEAEKNGTSIGEIEDAKQRGAEDKADPSKDSKESEEEKEPDNSETPAEDTNEQPRIDGKFAPKDPSQFEKAKKEKERLTKGWSEFESECQKNGIEVEALNTGKRGWKDLERCKNFVRKQLDAATAAERAQLEAERDRMQAQAQNRGAFSPQEYHKAAQEFQEAAWKALSNSDADPVAAAAKAKELFANANACMSAAQRTWEYTLMQSREKDIRDTIKKYPELDDVNGEAGKAMQQLLRENPYLTQLPDGFSKAAQFLAAQRNSARVSELEGQLKQITAERDEARQQLKAATSLAGAGSQAPPAPQSFDNMSDTEQERAVERMFSSGGEFLQSS